MAYFNSLNEVSIVYIDYDSDDLVRIPKDSYYWYKNKIQNRRKSFNGKIHSIY